jgi:hypothetical protein
MNVYVPSCVKVQVPDHELLDGVGVAEGLAADGPI